MLWLLRATAAVATAAAAATTAQPPQPPQPPPQVRVNPAFFFPSFHNRPRLVLNGDAKTDAGDLVVAGPERERTGSVFFSEPFNLSRNWEAAFTLSVTQVDNTGHEGLAFVAQSEAAYALGKGGSDLGYAGIGEGLAVEFDTARDDSQTSSHVAIKAALAPGSKLTSQHAADSGILEKIGPLPAIERLAKPVRIHVEYDASRGEVKVHVVSQPNDRDASTYLVAGSAVGEFPANRKFYVGFTAATGRQSAARFAVLNWRFGSAANSQGCIEGFRGQGCAITNAEAERWCQQRESCDLCAQDVYNCMWCVNQRRCVVGTKEATAACTGIVDEPGSCDGGLSLVWLWTLIGVTTTVFVLGLALVRTLPKAQAFKAVSLLVSTVLGALAGMALAYLIAACLVEVSASVLFAGFFGLFFLVEGALVAQTLWAYERSQGITRQLVCLGLADVWILVAGFACFVLNKRLILWLPEAPKILLYGCVAGAMTFCTVFSVVDLANEVHHRWHHRRQADKHFAVHDLLDPTAWAEPDGRRVLTVARSQAKTAVLLAASLLSGVYFGYIFGVLKIEEKQLFRAALAVRQETKFTLPAGALIGGLCGLLLQVIEWPAASDWEIEKKLSRGASERGGVGDDL